MASSLDKRFSWLVPLLVLIVFPICESNLIRLRPGQEYIYQYDATTELKMAGVIKTSAKIGISQLGSEKNGQLCRLRVISILQYLDHQSPEGDVLPHSRHWDMTKWFSFIISHHGEVTSVFYPEDENIEELTLKKMFVGLFTSKLHTSEELIKSGKDWTYQVNETGHEGEHESTYTATPTTNGVVFRRKKHGHIVPNAETKHEKEILYNSDLKLPHTINIEERFSAPREADPNYDMFAGIPGDKRKKEQNEMHDYDIPEMASSSTGTLKYLSTELLQFAHINVTITQPDNLVNDSIQIAAYIKNRVPLEEIVSEIKGNLSCVWKNKVIESVERSSCFNKLVQLLSRLSPTNLTIVAERYITNNASSEKEVAYRNIVIDSLGAVATETSQMLLTEMIFLSNNPDPNLVFRTLSHFLALQKPPPGKFVDVLMKMAFKKTFVFPDDKNTTNVHHKALLVLGSVAEVLLQSEPQKAYGIVAQLEDTLGVHDPVNHRHTRSIMSDKEYQSHLHNKAILIHSLGNAAFDSSYEYFISYMNNTGSPSLLRRSGVLSVSRYSHEQAANTLLDMAMNDHEEHVRYAATIEYQRHPHALDFDELIQEYVAVHTNRTDIADTDGESNRPLYRSRRSILDGFQFELKLPFVDWGKTIGSKAIGASIGFLMRNFLNLDIKPFSGNLNVHVEDAAWAIAHIGLLNLNLEFVHAKLCFKGHGSYSLNILQEFGFYDIIELVKKYDGVVRNMINSVENTIKTFKNLLSSAESNANSVFDDFVAVIEDLPNRIRDLRNIGKNLVRVIGEYSGLPEFVTDVRNIVDRVSTLVNDIKTDVMEFYNSIVDTITVTLPWAAEQIMDAIEAAAQAVKKLFKSPRTAITDIAKSIYKIKAAIAGVFDAKNRIVKACFFLDGQKPYWFNLRDEIAGIVEDILNAKDNLGDALEWITEGAKDDDTFKKFTGVPLSTIKQQIIDEIWGEFDTLITPVRMIERLAEPFVLAYDSFVGTIESIKQAYEGIKRAYDDAKTTINKIFGPKMGKKFPRVIATGSCGDGRFENTNQNTLPGIDLEANAGDELTAPFDGTVSVTGNNQITLVITRELKDNEIILYNVILDPGLENQHVSKDHRIGTVASSDCSPNIIHLSLRTQEVHEYIDPTSYLMKREMPPPGWHIECDDYVLIYKMKVEMSGSITGGAVKSDTSPDRTSEPDTSDMDSIAKRRKRGIINDLFGAAKDFVDGLGFPGIDELGPVFDFNMNALNVGNVFDFLENAQMTPLKDQLEMLLEKLQNAINTAGCQRPESMDIKELRNGLQLKKKSTTGSRDELVKRYLESEEKCFGLRNALSKNIYCTFDEHCLGVTCCIDLQLGPYLHRSFNAYVQYNPCNFELVIGVDSWTKTFNLIDFDFADADEEGEPTIESIDVLDAVKITVKHKIEMTDGKITVTLETELCATEVDICLAPVKILDEATIDVPLCDEVMQEHVDSVKQQQETGTGIVMSELTLGELEILLDQYGIDEKDVTNLLTDLRKLYQEMTKEAINTKLSEIFDDEFTNFDMCMDGDVHMERGANFFDYRIDFMVGPIPMYLGFGSGGTFGMTYGTNVCLLSMIAELTVRPQIGAQIYGYLGINLYVLTAELRMTGYLMTISFPTKAQIQFDHFPIDVAARMDMNLVPLRLELRAILTFEIYINLAFSSIHIKKILYNQVWWEYTTPMITGNIFNIGELEPDETPPVFKPMTPGVSFKRSASQANQGCFVHQVEGRDYTDPAYELELSVEDDKSEVDMTFCIGTYKGGCDVLKDESMGGFSTVFEQVLRGGVPLYYTISAKNSAGAVAKATCELPTYDVTLPGGRVVPDFLSTSHPNILKASAVALDDSIIMQREEAVGYGQDIFGDQVIIWNSFEMEKINHEVDIGLHDPLGTKSLEYFASPRLGRLRSTSHHTTSYLYATNCAKDCLALPPTKCLSFNYDYGENGLCELMEEIEGHGVELHENGYFYNFERLGIGHAVEFIHDDLQLRHNDLHLFNIHLNNSLGYSNIINSKGVLVDFVPPEPGPINNAIFDAVSHETCTEYVPDEWENRCIEETPLPNHRSIVDGFGSSCVFNGHETLVDMLYTRANKYVSANWDGFHDLETHIFGYTWTVGTDHCLDDIHPHKDPHSHLFDESEWTHTGIAHPLELDDGQYHVTVRALNKVEFGGPLATTVCHTTPYTIDNTPPLVHDVNLIEYDEIACHIITEYNVSDPHSGIREIDFGLGRSNRDVYLLGWQRHDNITHIGLDYCIADGIPAWIKIRAINNVDLRTVGHSDFPILVDRSHPIPGDVFDGSQHGVDIDYQSTSDAICANWQNFLDMESGIRKYTWGVGTFPGGDDVVSFYDLPHTVLQQCSMNVSLTHNTTYYTTIFAYNAGHKSLNVSVISDGVLYDATPPIEGELRDGLDPNIDMSYSSELATVSANWNGYSDPESGIGEYDVSVYRRHADFDNGTESILKSSMQLIHVVTSLTPDTDHINWHHFHLHHGDFVYVELDAVNQADNPTTTQSDGFTIDVTNPIMHFLGDGINAGVDRQYTSSTSELSANWEFQDPESGIDHYKLAVYQTQGGTRRQIYPQDRTKSLSISPDQNDWTSDNPLTLLTGRHYSIRVTAVNGAGLSTVHDTDGVIVDPTPPRMRKIFVGVLAGESEEIFDGFVLQTDPNGILATWFATDAESGIVAYWVAVGTTPEGTDVSDYRNMGSKRDGYVDELSLQLYNTAANGPVYYITVKAENGAGSMSESLTSSPIKVLQGDIAGITDDGPDTQTIGTNIVSVDTDYQKEDTVVTAQFHGFESQVHGIVYYEWAVGTQPRLDDIQPYTDAGIVVDNQHGNPGEGLSGSGKAQMPLQLDSGVTYFTTVRAITGAGNALDSVSDGFTVDLTSPVITIDSLGVIVDNNTLNLDVNTAHYQESVDSLAAEWEITEDESTIIYTSFSYGSYPGADDIYNITDVTEIYSVPNGMVVPEGNGKPNILALKSINQVGLWTETISGSVTVDTSPPIAGIVECPRYSVAIDELFCSWSHFYDDESFISHYEFGIGISEGDDSLFSYKKIESHINSYRARDLHGGSLQHSGRYYVTIIAYNGVGLKSQSFSQPIVIDDTPPVQGSVIEWSGVDEIDVSVDDTEKSSTCTTDEECALLDVVCQKSLTQISVTWQPFQDPESPIIRYQVAAGTSPGGTQLQEYQDVPLDSYYTVITGLDLTDIEVGYVSVKATNAAGLTSTAMSNGVFISRISLGLPSLRSSHVWDGNGDKDFDYQENNEMLSGQWDFTGDPCPISKYEWSIQGFDGTEIQPMIELPEGQTHGMNDQVSLKDGESYYLVVRATNLLGYTLSLRSNGVTIQKDPLLPGQVRDGDVIGFDINYQPSVTRLSANWDGFGVDGLMAGETKNQQHQMIEHYEIAAGTDRRYPAMRTNIHPFIHVGLNKTHTFTDLQLVPKSVTYYITVRAYSVSTAMKEVTSNGIQVGYGGKAVSLGEVTVSRYVASKTSMTVVWGDFEFTLPVMFYQWGLGTLDSNIDDLTCTQLQNFNEEGKVLSNPEYAHLFDKHPLTNTGKDTMVIPDNLELEEGHTYTVVVIATDESAQCSLVSDIVTIDTTPPVEGRLQIGAFQSVDVTYTKQPEQLDVTWSGYYDDISGIQYYELALYEGQSCEDSGHLTIVQDYIQVLPNDTDYTFLDLLLQDSRPYYVRLKATNNAGQSVITTSPPILLDVVDPVGGVVKDGDNYKVDRMYQSSTNHMKGVFLHLPNPDSTACPTRDFSLDSRPSSTDWLSIVDSGIWSVNAQQKVIFSDNQVSYSATDGLSITMTRDVNKQEMRSAAVSYGSPDVHVGGKYQVEIIAAGGDTHAVTSFTFWDGPSGVVGDINAPLGEKTWEDSVIEKRDCRCCENENIAGNNNHSQETMATSQSSAQDTVTSSQDTTQKTVTSPRYTTQETTSSPQDTISCECNCTAYFIQIAATTTADTTAEPLHVTTNSWIVVGNDLPDKTFTGDESLKNYAQTALGLQLHSGVNVNDEIKHFAVMWSRFVNDTYEPKHKIIELSFDPSQAWHTYCLLLTMNEVGDRDDWTVELLIDGVPATIITDVPSLSETAKLVMSVWNRLDYVPEITDIFNPPTSTASFRNLKLPPPPEMLCRYGDPFRNGENAIEGFMAGVGSERLLDDVVPFRLVTSPCIPCVKPCDLYNCDSSCSNSLTTLYHIELDDLNLKPEVNTEEDGQNVTVPATYYLTVKAVTGSGRSAVVSSDGVLIDVTPPVIVELYHVDMAWSDAEPTEYQSSDNTIAVRWDVYDLGSQVKDIQYAIGSQPNSVDLQNFKSVKLHSTFAVTDGLQLVNRAKYYVTLKVTNNAGLESVMSSTGVTVIGDSPDTSHGSSSSYCGQPLSNGLVKCNNQQTIGLSWVALDDNLVDAYYFSVGSSSDSVQDVIPQVQVGLNVSGSVRVEGGVLMIGETPAANLSAMRERDLDDEKNRLESGLKEEYTNRFLIEPGKVLVSNLKVCNKGHKCSKYNVENVAMIREKDEVITSEDGGDVTLNLFEGGNNDKPRVIISTDGGLPEGSTLAAGILTSEDLSKDYGSDASVDYKSFIVNPKNTKDFTSRALTKRIEKFMGNAFYMNLLDELSVTGKINITMSFNMLEYKADSKPRIIFWHTGYKEWHDASHTCADSFEQYFYDLDEGTVTTQVCSTTHVPVTSGLAIARKRRQELSDNTFTGPTAFNLANINNEYQNTPPVITSDNPISMKEDSGTLKFLLRASDAEGDDILFKVDDSSPFPQFGTVELTLHGHLSYKPCQDCYGEDIFYFIAFEQRIDGVDSLSVSGALTILVTSENDPPEIFVAVHGNNMIVDQKYDLEMIMEQRHLENIQYQDIIVTVGAWDVDVEDELNLLFGMPSQGFLEISKQKKNFTFIAANCTADEKQSMSTLTWQPQWTELEYPCEMTNPYETSRQSWVACFIRYRPNEYYYGDDEIKISVEDMYGARSEIATMTFHIMQNKCTKNGKCIGPVSDPNCTSIARSEGFDEQGYGCACSLGYDGQYCENDFDDCSSSPCQSNYSCIDQVNSHICYCAADWPCAQLLSDTEIIGISLSVVAVVLLAIVVLLVMYAKLRKDTRKKVLKNKESQLTSPDKMYPRSGLWFSDGAPDKSKQSLTIKNPVYDYGATADDDTSDGHDIKDLLQKRRAHMNDYLESPIAKEYEMYPDPDYDN